MDQTTTIDKSKIYASLHVPNIPPCYIVVEAVTIISERVRQINIQAQFINDNDTWPPEQLNCFTPLLLIQYQGLRSSRQVMAIAKLDAYRSSNFNNH